MWAAIGIVPAFGGIWPDLPIRQTYRGRSLLLRPDTEQLLASVSVEISADDEYDSAFLLLRRFLSAVAWGQHCGIREHMRLGGSALPRIGRGPLVPAYAPARVPRAHVLWAPEPLDPQALLALALYREGLSEDNFVYQYLSFFKILEIQAAGRTAIRALAAKHLPKARQRAPDLTDSQHSVMDDTELARYLYEEGRCAIAHAHSHPLVDPDSVENTRNIAQHLPLVQALAELVIEEEFNVNRWWPENWHPDWSRVTTE